MFALRKDPVGNELIPLLVRSIINEDARLIFQLRTKVAQRPDKFCFRWSLRTNFRIDMYLYECRVGPIILLDTFYSALWSDSNMRLVKSLIAQRLVGIQDPQQLVLIFVRKLMRAVVNFFDGPETNVRSFQLVLMGERGFHSS